MTGVVVYVRDDRAYRHHLAQVMAHVEQHHLEVVAVAIDADGRKWRDALRMVEAGEADRIVVANAGQIPLDRRVVVAAEVPDDVPPMQRRPRVIRRADQPVYQRPRVIPR